MRSIKRRGIHKESQVGIQQTEVLKFPHKINAEADLSSLLHLIAREAANLTEADRASIFLLDREKQELWSIVTLDGTQIRLDARMGLAGIAALNGKIVNVKDVQEDPRFYKRVDAQTGFRTRSILIVPFKNHEGQVMGTFQALNKRRGAFTKDDERVLQTLAEQAATIIQTPELISNLKRLQEELVKENKQLRKEVEERFSTQNIVGTSPEIQNVVRLIEQISDSSANVMITGESGTGKELVAKAIHYNSQRSQKPFVAVNCAAIPESLIESDLFGIEKGVATGVEQRIGKFEEVQGGTLFLDEIGDLSLAAQAKILRVIQDRIIQRVGGRKAIPIEARIVTATNKDLESEIERGNFRKDLYYRLREIQIQMPPLREIPEDIPLLVKHFLTKYSQVMDIKVKKIAAGAIDYLINYSWPGNVRELENKIKRLMILIPRKVITEDDIPEAIREGNGQSTLLRSNTKLCLKKRIEELEKQTILEALETSKQNQKQTAKLLGLSRQGLINKMKRYGIKI